MDLLAHWYAAEGDGVPWVVMQDEDQMVNAIAECGTKAHAEMIARALNNQRAVEALERVEQYARKCALLRMEPTTRGLRDALDGTGSGESRAMGNIERPTTKWN